MSAFLDTQLIKLPPIEPDLALAGALRLEAEGMAVAYLDALLEMAPSQSLAGVYMKGSACKLWSSLADYVPEVSDVDIHVRFNEDRVVQSFDTTERALDVAGRALAIFTARFPRAAHLPRPQLLFLNEIEKSPGYLPSPRSAVRTLHGEEYVEGSREAYTGTVAEDARRFLSDADFVEHEVPMKVIDRPGRFAWNVVSRLTWRVGPAGPRLLTQLGVPPYDAWCLNRTAIIGELATRADTRIAEAYAAFYLAAWDGFRSRFQDGDAAVRAVFAALALYREGRTLLR